MLVAELRKIEMRKKEREKKQQDLQKLITAAENQADSYRLKYDLLSGSVALLRLEWSHLRISSTNSKVRTTLNSIINSITGKFSQ